MGLFFKNKKKDKIVAIFDIGSSSIGGAKVFIPHDTENEVPVILDSVRLEMKSIASSNINDLEKEACFTLKKTAEALFSKKIGKLDEVICTMTTPWISSETKRVSVSKQSKFIVSKKFLGELVDKELSKITQDLKEKFETEREVIEKLIAEVSIDDEPTDNPINEECQFLDLYLSYSHTNKNFVTKSKEALESVFHSTPVSFSSFSILTYLMIRDSYVNQRESYLILDIAGETTDLSVVNRGIFGEKYSFPSGKKTLLKHLALDLKIEERDALELFRLYYQNNLSLNHREKLKKYFESLERFWSEEFKHYLDTILKYHQLPKFIFLTIDVDMRNWFFEVFKKTELANNLTLDKRFQIIILDQTEMIDKCSLEVGNHDPFIMIEAIALSKK